MSNERRIGKICHEYGCLLVKQEGGKFYWSIEANTFENWEEIPESLFMELNRFQDIAEITAYSKF